MNVRNKQTKKARQRGKPTARGLLQVGFHGRGSAMFPTMFFTVVLALVAVIILSILLPILQINTLAMG